MMIKFLGVLFIIMSMGFIGTSISSRYRFRMSEIDDLIESFQIFFDEITHLNQKIPHLMKKLSERPGRGNLLFQTVHQELNQSPYMDFEQAWEYALWEARSKTHLHPEDLDVLKMVPMFLKISDRESHGKNREYLINRLKEQEKKAWNVRLENEKLVKVGYILLGATVVILLY